MKRRKKKILECLWKSNSALTTINPKPVIEHVSKITTRWKQRSTFTALCSRRYITFNTEGWFKMIFSLLLKFQNEPILQFSSFNKDTYEALRYVLYLMCIFEVSLFHPGLIFNVWHNNSSCILAYISGFLLISLFFTL